MTESDAMRSGTERSPSRAPGASSEREAAGFRLPEGTRVGPIELRVSDLERSLAFYQTVLGLTLLARESSSARLGTPSPEHRLLLELVEQRGAHPVPDRGRTGLFHVALLLPDRADLAAFVRHLSALGVPAGAGDHGVSEAFYLQDPDNLGIEVYADRPRSAWRWSGRELAMTTDPVDIADLLSTAKERSWTGAPLGTTVGHVHLRVADLGAARAFYGEGLGFDCTAWSYPGALFFAAGGYHHHLGTNIWSGRRASPPAQDEARLIAWTLELPAEPLADLLAHLARAGIAVETGGAGAKLLDPWGTRLRLAVAAP